MKSISFKKAIPGILLGIAFFLTSCQGRIPGKKEGAPVLPVEIMQAEFYMQEGKPEKALDMYESYLKKEPEGKYAPRTLHHMAEIYAQIREFEKSLLTLDSLIQRHPEYEKIPQAIYEKMKVLYLTERYLQSTREGLSWLKSYPSHPLKPDVMILLGENAREMENAIKAFEWWIGASKASRDKPAKLEEAIEKIHFLISLSTTEVLEKLAEHALGTGFAPQIYHTIAERSLLRYDTERAYKAVQNLLDSTSEDKWISAANDIIERIHDISSVNPKVLGCLLPLSGDSSPYGEEVLNGIQLGMGPFSESGQHFKLELVIKDTGGNTEKAARAVKELVEEEGSIAIIGPLLRRTASAAAEEAQRLGVPIITLTQEPGVTKGRDMVFRNLLTPEMEVEALLSIAMGRFGVKRFAIMYPENGYGKHVSRLFWDKLQEMGGTVTAAESYAVDKTDFSDQIKKLIALHYPKSASLIKRIEEERLAEDEESTVYSRGPMPIIDFEAIFIPDTFERVAMITPQLLYYDTRDVFLFGTNLWQSPELIKKAGDYVQGAIFTSGYFEHSGQPGVEEFADQYQRTFDTEPDILAATGYDTIRIIREIMHENDIRTRKDFRNALLWSTGFPGITGTLFFDFSGEVKKDPFLLTVLGDQIRLLE